MAKVLMGAGTIDQRNKIAGWVYTKSRYGLNIKRKSSPRNVRSKYQNAHRSIFRKVVNGWKTMYPEQRLGWINRAPEFPYYDIFGERIILSPQALFFGLNINLLRAGIPIRHEIGSLPVFPILQINFFYADIPTHTLEFNWYPGHQPVGTRLFIYVTDMLPVSVTPKKKMWRFLKSINSTGNAVDIGADYEARFSRLIPNRRIGLRLLYCDVDSGVLSSPVTTEAFT